MNFYLMLQIQFHSCVMLAEALRDKGARCGVVHRPGDVPFVTLDGQAGLEICADPFGKFDLWYGNPKVPKENDLTLDQVIERFGKKEGQTLAERES